MDEKGYSISIIGRATVNKKEYAKRKDDFFKRLCERIAKEAGKNLAVHRPYMEDICIHQLQNKNEIVESLAKKYKLDLARIKVGWFAKDHQDPILIKEYSQLFATSKPAKKGKTNRKDVEDFT